MADTSELLDLATNMQSASYSGKISGSWSVAHRIAFRFMFSYLMLCIFPFPFNSHPGTLHATTYYDRTWRTFAVWIGTHVLHFRTNSPSWAHPILLTDTTFGYTTLVCFAAFATLATILWTLLDRKRGEYRWLNRWFRDYARYMLAFTMVAYGMGKVIPVQFVFARPAFNLMLLALPLGYNSGTNLLWTFMGYSTPYTMFAGASEVIGGTLLLFRRTATVGGLILCGTLANVVALNFCYDVPVKVFSSLLLFLAMFTVAPDVKRLANVLLLNRPAAAVNQESQFGEKWTRVVPRLAIETTIAVVALAYFGLHYSRYAREVTNIPKSPIYGLYQVESFTQDGKVLSDSDMKWRRVIFAVKNGTTIITMDDAAHNYATNYDVTKNDMTLRNSKGIEAVLTYSQLDSAHLELRGTFMSQPVVIEMQKVDISKFQLLGQGFHWVQGE